MQQLTRTAYGVFFHEADVTSPTSLSRTAQHVRNRHGHPTILINNAGVGRHHNLLEASEADVRRAFDVNAMSHFWAVREFFPAMVLANHGHVVSVASTASFLSVGGMVDYACTKAAVLAFHEGLAQELRFLYKAPSVRTSIVHPVFVQTALIKEYTDAGLSTHHAVLEPADVAAAVVGQIITQNSGQVVLPRRKTWYSVVRVLPAYLQEPVRDAGTRLLLKLGAANKNG